MRDQGLLSNLSDWAPICTVKCFSQITLLKNTLTLVSWRGLYTSQSDPPWPQNRIIVTFAKPNLCPKTDHTVHLNLVYHKLGSFQCSAEVLTCKAAWHVPQVLAHIHRLSR